MTHRRDVDDRFVASALSDDAQKTFQLAIDAAIRIAGSHAKQQRFVAAIRDLLDDETRDFKSLALCIRAILTQHVGAIDDDADVSKIEAFLTLFRALEQSDTVVELSDAAVVVVSDKLRIWQGDITTLRIGAIVNAANSGMLGCFTPMHRCIDNEIHFYAGPRLRLACEDAMRDQPPEPIGRCRLTPAFLLPSDHVAHTVGPNLHEYESRAEQPELLASCYRACLDAIKAAGVRSIAFCGISTGVFGYPKRAAAVVAVATVRAWLAVDENAAAVDCVMFNTFDAESTSIYKELLLPADAAAEATSTLSPPASEQH
jgi:O-acetyl-ADP-ribose deacetylase (regulator of RNase III)